MVDSVLLQGQPAAVRLTPTPRGHWQAALDWHRGSKTSDPVELPKGVPPITAVLTEWQKCVPVRAHAVSIEWIRRSVEIALKAGLLLNPERGQGTLCYGENEDLHISCASV